MDSDPIEEQARRAARRAVIRMLVGMFAGLALLEGMRRYSMAHPPLDLFFGVFFFGLLLFVIRWIKRDRAKRLPARRKIVAMVDRISMFLISWMFAGMISAMAGTSAYGLAKDYFPNSRHAALAVGWPAGIGILIGLAVSAGLIGGTKPQVFKDSKTGSDR